MYVSTYEGLQVHAQTHEGVGAYTIVQVRYVCIYACIHAYVQVRYVYMYISMHVFRFGHFDILQDEEVRQGLKEYSKWPTYPQVPCKLLFRASIYLLVCGYMCFCVCVCFV